MSRHSGSLILVCSAWIAAGAGPLDHPKRDRPALEMSTAVVCKKVVGYEDFVELPDASLTSEDKLNVYFRPLNFRVEAIEKPKPGARYKARFVEDCRIRRKGEKTPLQKKDKLVEYDPTFNLVDQALYMVNNISLKGLPPGEYELDIILHDAQAADAQATQTVAFTIVPTPIIDPAAKDEGAAEPEVPAAPKSKEKEKAKAKTPRKTANSP